MSGVTYDDEITIVAKSTTPTATIVLKPTTLLMFTVTDIVTITEDSTVRLVNNVGVYDSSTVTDAVTVNKNCENINVYDGSTVTDVVSVTVS
jgi:hypothetical protein